MHLSTYSNTTISIITNIWKLPISFRPIPVYHPPRIGQLIQFWKKIEKFENGWVGSVHLKLFFAIFATASDTRRIQITQVPSLKSTTRQWNLSPTGWFYITETSDFHSRLVLRWRCSTLRTQQVIIENRVEDEEYLKIDTS